MAEGDVREAVSSGGNSGAGQDALGRETLEASGDRMNGFLLLYSAMGAISKLLEADHDRLDALFAQARAGGANIDLSAYEEFRRGLLKHVGMEELILIPAASRLSGAAVPLARRTRLDHGAITSLLIPIPTTAILSALSAVLGPHNLMEEELGGLYEQCERAVGAEAETVFARLLAAPDIPPAAHVDGPRVRGTISRSLQAAGYTALAREFHS